MFHRTKTATCRVVTNVTDQETFLCRKPVSVILINHSPDPIALCLDCARELAKEILDSVPGGRLDSGRLKAARAARKAREARG